MKILMIGLGSIGQRHLRNIKRVYGEEAQILAYRVRGLKRTFSDTMQIRENVSLEEEYNIKSFDDLSKALLEKPDIAEIACIAYSGEGFDYPLCKRMPLTRLAVMTWLLQKT